MLPAQPRLGRAKDEEKEPGQEHGRGEGDEHDVAARRVEPRHEVGGVAPHGHDRQHLSVAVLDRQVLLHHSRRVRQFAGGIE